MFFVVALIAGSLYDIEKKLKEQYKKTSEERDATLRKLQETFERLRLADRLSTLGTLSAEMAHEIKNPLAGMYGSMEILEKEFQKDHPKYEFVQILKREIDRMSGIVHKYLDLARPHKPEKARHDLNAIVSSVVEIISKQAIKKDVRIMLQLSPALPQILIDGEQIKQAIMNILINAIQATPKGRSVYIASGSEESQLWVSIQDEGEGIRESDLGKVFDPLFTTKKDGTGIGLSVAYQIITQHNGQITVQSSQENGALFKITLPYHFQRGERGE
jgi:signal transduction histidine kinase